MTTLTAPAKLNLYLAVGPRRADGYHTLSTVLVALEFGDGVTVEPAARLSVACEPGVGVGECDNLAWRAAMAMGEAFDRSPDFAIAIDKRVPAGAGLAGGSADAAAVIAAIAAAWEVRRNDARLESVAASLGADVPFALRGGCGVYTGLGTTLQRTLRLPSCHFAIVNGAAPVSTAAAYAAFDAIERGAAPGARHVTDAVSMGDLPGLGTALFNNMTDGSIGLVPAIADGLAFMSTTAGCVGSSMCGSGSAVFGMFATEAEAAAAAAAGSEQGWWSVHTRPRTGGTLDQTMGVADDADQGRRRHPRRR
jgi:4-diphosphocytidyl-2-C-methyl-D-erythritol kinase